MVGEPYTGIGTESGTVHIYQRITGENAYHELIDPINGKEEDDDLGWSVAVTPDGKWIAAGAPQQINHTGAVYFYETGVDTVHDRGMVKGDEADDHFGWSVDISDVVFQGLSSVVYAAVGAPAFMSSDMIGYVRVFQVDLKDKKWIQVGKDIVGGAGDEFGSSVDLSSLGNFLVVGSPKLNKAQVYKYQNMEWEQVGADIVIDVDESKAALPANCGNNVVIAGDGLKLAMGCELYDEVFVFYWTESNSTGHWKQIDSIKGEVGFGESLSMSSYGNRLAIGEPDYGEGDKQGRGRVLIYEWDHDDKKYNRLDVAKGNPGANTGASVAISPEGGYFACGSPEFAPDNGAERGNVMVFQVTEE